MRIHRADTQLIGRGFAIDDRLGIGRRSEPWQRGRLGRQLDHRRGVECFRNRRWFPVSEAGLQRARRWYRRYGKWSLLLSWMPVIGDPLTLAAGIMKEPLPVFLLLVGVAKLGRYLVLAAATACVM